MNNDYVRFLALQNLEIALTANLVIYWQTDTNISYIHRCVTDSLYFTKPRIFCIKHQDINNGKCFLTFNR